VPPARPVRPNPDDLGHVPWIMKRVAEPDADRGDIDGALVGASRAKGPRARSLRPWSGPAVRCMLQAKLAVIIGMSRHRRGEREGRKKMHLPRRDIIATGLVAVAGFLYLLWAIDSALPGMNSTRVAGLIATFHHSVPAKAGLPPGQASAEHPARHGPRRVGTR